MNTTEKIYLANVAWEELGEHYHTVIYAFSDKNEADSYTSEKQRIADERGNTNYSRYYVEEIPILRTNPIAPRNYE